MADMPEMQEHFLTAMDGGNAENAGCIFRPAHRRPTVATSISPLRRERCGEVRSNIGSSFQRKLESSLSAGSRRAGSPLALR
jgi:hypothetical protein